MIDMEKICFYDTPVGKLIIGEENGAITRVTWTQLPKSYLQEETELILKCKSQLVEYFAGKRMTFDLPLAPKGTVFLFPSPCLFRNKSAPKGTVLLFPSPCFA